MMADAAADVNLAERLRDEERAYSVRLRQPNGKVSGKNMHAYVGGMAVSVFATSRKRPATGSRCSSSALPISKMELPYSETSSTDR